MARSRKTLLLAAVAIVTFPVTVALVAMDLRSVSAKSHLRPLVGSSSGQEEGRSSADVTTPQPNQSPPQSEVSNRLAANSTTGDAAVMELLRFRAENLSESLKKSKEDESRIKEELKENQNFQTTTKRSLKATERAIREIERQAGANTRDQKAPTLRSTGSHVGGANVQGTSDTRLTSQQHVPEGWEIYYGILGNGLGRSYRLQELEDPKSFLVKTLELPSTVGGIHQNLNASLGFHRIVHLSGVEAADPRLEELRRMGANLGVTVKRVRHQVAGFEGLYTMVQVLPMAASQSRAETGETGETGETDQPAPE